MAVPTRVASWHFAAAGLRLFEIPFDPKTIVIANRDAAVSIYVNWLTPALTAAPGVAVGVPNNNIEVPAATVKTFIFDNDSVQGPGTTNFPSGRVLGIIPAAGNIDVIVEAYAR